MVNPVAGGLTEAEASKRLASFGPNELGAQSTRSFWDIVLLTMKEPLFLLIAAASGLYLVMGDIGEGLFLTAGASLSVGLVIVQEVRSERALKSLRDLSEPFAWVVRDGTARRIPARLLVPGDRIQIAEGQRVPADAVLRSGDVLTLDESALTGESAPVCKSPDPEGEPAAEAVPGEAGCGSLLFSGALVVGGQGLAEVFRTGASSALGRIGSALAAIGEEPTPFQKKAHRLVAVLGVSAIAFCLVVVAAYGLLRHDWIGGALSGLTVAVALVPEEIPMVLAVFLALGSWRLAKRQVLVRRSAIIETLGSATLLCVDKTGTLTEGRMVVARLWTEAGAWTAYAGSPPPAILTLLQAAALASTPGSIDPMDRAIADLGDGGAPQMQGPQRSWPLRPERLAVVQIWRDEAGDLAAAKGAPEAIFRLCRLDEARKAVLSAAVEAMAAEGLRVLAAASCRFQGEFTGEPEEASFAFEGLIGFFDPLRRDAAAALREASAAGISVAMITGDYPATALAIARQAGVNVRGGVLTGAEIAALSDEELHLRIGSVRVFARIQPDQKLRLVRAFQANGEIVAMSGDGVNDGPALEAAHVGIAMGLRGTDVAREAADLVLLDDSFASIIGGVQLGRRIFVNLRKALTYVTAIHVPIAGLALGPILLGFPPLLLPMHVVLLELAVDPLCSLVFEAEAGEPGAMRRPPRRASELIFGPRQLLLGLAQGAVVLAGVLAFYAWALGAAPEREARGAAFAALILANLTLANVDALSSGAPLFGRSRRVFWGIVAAAIAVLFATLVVPGLAEILDIAPPAPVLMALAVACALVSAGWLAPLRALRAWKAAAPCAPSRPASAK